MQLSYEISVVPLLSIAAIMLCLTGFATKMYLKTNIRTDLYLALAFGLITLMPLTIFWQTGPYLFWSEPYHMALLTVSCLTLTTYWLGEKRTLEARVPFIIVTVITAGTLIFPSTYLVGLGIALSLFISAIYLYILASKGYKTEWFRMIAYIILGLLITIGGIFSLSSFAMIYTLTLIVLTIYEAIRYFERIIELLKNAGMYSMTDPLTKIYNKGYLLKKSAQLVQKEAISVIFCDIDNFKKLNDTQGHDYGDQVLIETAAILKKVLSKSHYGFAARYGGEELLGISTCSFDEAVQLANIFRVLVEKEVGVTVSVGVAQSSEITSSYRMGLEKETIKLADERMYKAKNSGKNKVVVE